MKYSKIVGIGSYLPSKVLTNNDLSKLVDTTDEWITTRTGIKQRHIVDDNQTTSDLAMHACQQALANSQLTIGDIDAIVVATTTPDKVFPSVATILQRKLNMQHGFAFDIQAVCSGFVYALTMADALIKAQNLSRVLVVGAEVFSKILDWHDRRTCVLFGDGAGACILEATDINPAMHKNAGILGYRLFSTGECGDDLTTTGGIFDVNNPIHVTMNGSIVFKSAVNKMAESSQQLLQQYQLTVDDLDFVIPHQANMRILNSMVEKMHLDVTKVADTLKLHGNTSAASIPLALAHLEQNQRIKSGDLLLLTSLGGGFTWGSLLLRL